MRRATFVAAALMIACEAKAIDIPVPPTPAADMSCTFRHSVRDVDSLKGLPPSIRAYLQKNADSMADRGEFFNVTDSIVRPGPGRRFIRGGESGGKWFVAYETGGIAYYRTVLLLENKGEVIKQDASQFYSGSLCLAVDNLLDGHGTRPSTHAP